MPSTLWSAPSSALNSVSQVTSSFTTATLTDISPGQCLIPPGTLNAGTRVRLTAHGSYIATTTASTITWGFYMNQAGTAIGTTEAILGVTPAITAVAVSGIPWVIQWWGRMTTASANTGTNAVIVGRGQVTVGTSLTALATQQPIPQTLAATIITQTATGLVTYTEQNVMLGATIATNTGLTSITVDELTCELIG